MIRVITDEMKKKYLLYFDNGFTISEAVSIVSKSYDVKHSRQLIHQSVKRWYKQGLLKSLPPSAKAGRKPKGDK